MYQLWVKSTKNRKKTQTDMPTNNSIATFRAFIDNGIQKQIIFGL